MPAKNSKVKKATVKKKKATKTKPVIKKTVVEKTIVSSLSANIYNTQGKIVSKMQLPKEIFGAKINKKLMAQAVRVYMANQRKGSFSTQTRGDVTGSTAKIWRQKGTGRARHGSRKAPIFVGGGVAFGPTLRDFSLKFPKKMKRASLFSALSSKQKAGDIKIVTGFEKIEPKTKIMAKAIKNLGIEPNKRPVRSRKVLLVTSDFEKNGLEGLYRASRNLEGLDILNVKLLNTYEVLRPQMLILMKDSIDTIKNTFMKGAK